MKLRKYFTYFLPNLIFAQRKSGQSNNFELIDNCGKEILIGDERSGIITSPVFNPSRKTSHYPSNSSCKWRIIAPAYHYIELTIDYIDIEAGASPNDLRPTCPYDSLSIYDLGNVLMNRLPDGKKNLLDDFFEYTLTKEQIDTININMVKKYREYIGGGIFCGRGPFEKINSYSNIVQLEFESDESAGQDDVYKGFQISYKIKPSRLIADSFTCTFDEGLCPGWRQAQDKDGGDQFDWDIKNGQTESENTGPQFDHTRGDLCKYLEFFSKFLNFFEISRKKSHYKFIDGDGI